MTDLYRVLGVRRNASHQAIRAAYRNLAKSAHPDVGGERAAFDQLKLAHDILTDPERRKRYDATGEVRPVHADNSMAEVLTVVSVSLDAVLGEIGKVGRNAVEFDIVGSMRGDLQKRLAAVENNRLAVDRGMKQMQSIVGRFSVKRGENLLETVLRGKLSQADLAMKKFAHEHELVMKALALLDDYGFAYEVRQMVVGYVGMPSSTTSITSWV